MAQLIEIREAGLAPWQTEIDGVVEVGRDCAGILLSDPETSRRHAALTAHADGTLWVHDLGSTNGTTLNGVPVLVPTQVRPGDIVEVGESRIVALGPVVAGIVAAVREPERVDPPDLRSALGAPPAKGSARVTPAQAQAPVQGQAPVQAQAPAPAPVPAPVPAPLPAPVQAQAPVAGRASVPQPVVAYQQGHAPAPGAPGVQPPGAPVRPERRPPPGRSAGPGWQPPVRPALEELAEKVTDAAVLRYRPGSAGEAAAAGYAAAVRRARKRLAGLGSEPWGVKPQICLVDPFPDPDDPGMVLSSGTIVDAVRGEIWAICTAESPPEQPERALALFFGAALPGGRELERLVEGYGLHLSGVPSPDTYLAEQDEEEGLPPLPSAEGQLRTLMALSFVRYLLERGGEPDFLRLLTTSQAGTVDQTAQQIYGTGLSGLEEQWLQSLETEDKPVRLTQFLKIALRYVRPYFWREVEIFIYLLLQLSFGIAFPLVLASLTDLLVKGEINDLSRVGTLVGILVAAFAVSLGAELRRSYVSAYVGQSIVRQLRGEMFAGLQSLSAGWFAGRKQGDVLSRLLTDVGQLQQGLSVALRDGTFQLMTLLSAAAVLLYLSPVLGLVVLLGAPVVGVIYRKMDGPVLKRSKAVSEHVGSLVSIIAESFQAHPVVQAFGLEGEEKRRFGRAADRLFKRQLSLQLFGGLFDLSVDVVVTILRIVVLFLGAYLVLSGHITLGAFTASMTQVGAIVGPVQALAGLGQQIQASTGSLQRVDEILNAKPEVADDPRATPLPPLRQEIRLADVWFAYEQGRPTLRGIDVRIPAGSKVAFVGPTGAGKSSVLQMLMRFYDPKRGGVLLDGRDIRTGTVESLRSQLGVVFQETFLFDGTLRDNIGLGRLGASTQDIEAAAKAAQMHEFIRTLPRGYDTPVGERGVRLSGGQKQRLALARALLRNPAVLLLDEATSALDPRTERLIAATLDEVASGRTLISVTHRLTSITEYDQIYVLDEGEVVERGRHAELVAADGVYAELWAEQNGGVGLGPADSDGPAAGPAPEPTGPVVDPAAALAQVPVLAGLNAAERALVVQSLRTVRLEPGDELPERRGRLAILRSGRGEVLAPDPAGRPVRTAVLGPGQLFGLSALLGDENGAVLRAVRPLELWVLPEDALFGLAEAVPAIGAALGARRSPVAPLGGERLSQVRLRPPGFDRLLDARP